MIEFSAPTRSSGADCDGDFARQTGAFVIAEGVEDQDTLQLLRDIDNRRHSSDTIMPVTAAPIRCWAPDAFTQYQCAGPARRRADDRPVRHRRCAALPVEPRESLEALPRGVIRRGDGTEAIGARLEAMGLLELLIIILVLAAIFGGIAVSPLLFVLLIVVFVILFTRGGFGYRRGGRL